MKISIILMLVMLVVGCSSSANYDSGSLASLHKQCVKDTRISMRKAWSRYEIVTNKTVLYPDWRYNVMVWSRKQCKYGKHVPTFWP